MYKELCTRFYVAPETWNYFEHFMFCGSILKMHKQHGTFLVVLWIK